MGSEQEAPFYDAIYEDGASRYAVVPDEQPWAHVRRTVARRIPPGATVVDAGCGQGHLCALLVRPSLYTGADFSEVAIRQARDTYGESAARRFVVLDLRGEPLPKAEVYVFIEVLEHLNADLAVLHRLAPGSRVIITVPRRESASHVRAFPSLGEAVCYYEQAVTPRTAMALAGGFYLIDGITHNGEQP